MKRRILAAILFLIMAVSLAAMTVSAAAPAYYMVGYSKVDINPYFDENDHSKGLMPVPMAGNGYSDRRFAEPTKIDDTGDGKIDDRDGIFATCIAITDPSGQTMLIISADFCGSNPTLVTDLRYAIKSKYPQIDPSRVMFTASHTHSSIDLNVSGLSTENAAYLALYNQRLRENLLRAVDEALEDRSSATMYKGQIEANDSKAAKGNIGDTINKYRAANDQVTVLPAEDYPTRVYNSVRHYAISIYPAKRKVYKKYSNGKYAFYTYPKDSNKNYIPDLTAEPVTYIRGANFNPDASVGGTSTVVYYADANGNKIADTAAEAAQWEAATGKTAYWLADVNVVASKTNVSEGDDTLLAWEFRFKDTSRKPIVLINWRAHTTLNRYVSDDAEELKAQGKYQDLGFYTSYYQISGDWVNAMRFVLEEEGYRPAFVQGAAGNMVAGGSASGPNGSWVGYETETDRTHYRNKGNIYGTEMAEVALECLKEHMVQINKEGGDIRSMQILYQTQKQKIEPGMFMAAKLYSAVYTPAAPLGTRPYDVVYWLDANGDPLIDTATGKSMVDDTTGQALIQTDSKGDPITDSNGNALYYTDKDGNPVVGAERIAQVQKIASIHHANSVISKYRSTVMTAGQLELNVFTIGKEFAMVTAPNELFDRYSREATMETINQFNDWEKLWDADTYGEPFMMGYANDSRGYISYQIAWDYSKGVLSPSGQDIYAHGSYETQTGWFRKGTGEELIDVYKWMLDSIGEAAPEGDLVQYCQHCRKEVAWLPLSQSLTNTVALTQGHYYVDQSTLPITSITLRKIQDVCLDLRGNRLTTEYGRVLNTGSRSTLSIQDSVGGGVMAGVGYDGQQSGGTLFVDSNSTLNLYSGTLTNAISEGNTIYNGGVVYVAGTFNMYGGEITGGVSDWAGGNVYVNNGAAMNVYGGRITGGTAKIAHTNCVVSRGALTVSGDAVIDQARLWPNGGQPPMADILTVDGPFTGNILLFIEGAKDGMDIGNVTEGSSYGPENLYFAGSSFVPYIQDGNIVLGRPKAAAIYGEDGFEGYTDTVQDAINACQGTDKVIALQRKNGETNTVSQDVSLDLNGFKNTNPLTVNDGATLYLKDSATDDFAGSYGSLAAVTGSVKAMPGYLLHTEDAAVSAHAYGLSVSAAVLRPSVAGMYFIGNFKGDEQVKAAVVSYGIALDVNEPPSAATLNKTSKHTSYRDKFAETDGVTSVLLTDILKQQNAAWENGRNAQITVYCRPFIRFADGLFTFGQTQAISFRELLEQADALWADGEVPTDLQQLYATYHQIMDQWNIPNLKKTAQTPAPSPYRVYTPMTMEKINSLPIATEDMTPDQLRQLCVDFFRMQNTFQWVSESDIGYDIRNNNVLLHAGQVYAGSPYVARAKSGNLYMTMEFYDENTGVIRNPGMSDQEFMGLIGNHCTYGSFWGWARVINSMTTQWNIEMGLEDYGFIPLGEFSTAGIKEWSDGEIDTRKLRDAYDKQVILEGYANVKQADCLYVWFGGGGNSHIRMASRDAVVVRNPDGTIDAANSYIVYLDQTSGWSTLDIGGKTIPVQGGVDKQITFAKLYSAGYLPFTFAEFHGLDPVEEGQVTSSLEGLSAVTPRQLSEATLKANYAISHVTVSVTDEAGKELYRQNAFSPRINTLEMSISDAVDVQALEALASRHCTVTCRIGNGGIFTLFDGTLSAN